MKAKLKLKEDSSLRGKLEKLLIVADKLFQDKQISERDFFLLKHGVENDSNSN